MMVPHNMDMMAQMKHQHHRNGGFHQAHQQQSQQGNLQNQMFNPDAVVSQVDDFDIGQPMNYRDQQYQRNLRGPGGSPPQLGPGSGSYGPSQMSNNRMRQETMSNGLRHPQPYRPSPHQQMEPLNPDMFSDQPLSSQQNHQHMSQQGQLSSQHQQQPDELFHYQQQMKLQRMNHHASQMQGGSNAQSMHPSMFQERQGGNKMGNHLMPEDFRPRAQRPQC